jgi:hypothetical protein
MSLLRGVICNLKSCRGEALRIGQKYLEFGQSSWNAKWINPREAAETLSEYIGGASP